MAEVIPKAVRKPRQYEGMFLISPTVAAEMDNAMNIVRGFIERHGGQILVLKKWDERKLAYEVGKQKRGTYIISYFTAPSNALAPMERDVKLSEDVLRVMFTQADHLNIDEMNAVEPQPIVREERPSWEERPGDRAPRDRGPRGDRPPRREEAAVGSEGGEDKD